MVVYFSIFFVTLFGCSFVLALFYMERKNRKIAHNYVISMCIADIMHGCVGSAVCIHYCNGLLVGDELCHIETALMMATAYVSLFNLVTTAIDRYLSIIHPLKYRAFMTHEISYGIIAVGWLVGAGFGFGIIGLRSQKYLEVPNELCLYLTLVVEPIYLFAYVQLLVYAGVFVAVIFYIRIYVELRRVVCWIFLQEIYCAHVFLTVQGKHRPKQHNVHCTVGPSKATTVQQHKYWLLKAPWSACDSLDVCNNGHFCLLLDPRSLSCHGLPKWSQFRQSWNSHNVCPAKDLFDD